MQLTHSISALLLAATAQALPNSLVPRSAWNVIDVTQHPSTQNLQSRASLAAQLFIQSSDSNKCGGSSFNSKSTDYSADIPHCQCIIDNLKREEWKGKFFSRPVDGSKFGATAVTCLSCAFVITSPNDFGTNVGSEDVTDLVRDAIQRFGRKDKVGASGDMECENDSGKTGPEAQSKTTWTIEHVPN